MNEQPERWVKVDSGWVDANQSTTPAIVNASTEQVPTKSNETPWCDKLDCSLEQCDAMRSYLDRLRESGAINMFGAAPYLAEDFDLDKSQARRTLSHWMELFGKEHPVGGPQ